MPRRRQGNWPSRGSLSRAAARLAATALLVVMPAAHVHLALGQMPDPYFPPDAMMQQGIGINPAALGSAALGGNPATRYTPGLQPPTLTKPIDRPEGWPGAKTRSQVDRGQGVSLEPPTNELSTQSASQRYQQQLDAAAQRSARATGLPSVYSREIQAMMSAPYELGGFGTTQAVYQPEVQGAGGVRLAQAYGPPAGQPATAPMPPQQPAPMMVPAQPGQPMMPMPAPGVAPPLGAAPLGAAGNLPPPAGPANRPPAPPATPGAARLNAAARTRISSGLSTLPNVDGATQLARIGEEEVILGTDVLPSVDEIIEKNKDKISPKDLDATRLELIRRRLEPMIDMKLILADAKSKIPKENLPKINEQLGKSFEQHELKKRLEAAKIETRSELDDKLREMGTTLDREKRGWIEQELARSWLGQQMKFDEEITRDQMLVYYRQHIDDFKYPTRVRWEEIKVGYSSRRNRPEAWKTIAEAGNKVWAGNLFSDVAKTYSKGSTAREGGMHNWTTKGSHVSKVIDEALFSLPVGQMSAILEDNNNLYIIRVIERQEAGQEPFSETQEKIKQKIRQQNIEEQREAYLAKIRGRYKVWTIFSDEQTLSAQAPAETARQ